MNTKNKIYFTKYLPVEGEIKEGDIVSVLGSDGKNIYVPYKKTKQGKDFSTKYKLSLCSRDIQVGDNTKLLTLDNRFINTVIYGKPPHGGIIVKPINEHPLTDAFLAPEPEKRLYKLIGEISPDATWVKEGDEFDETEVKEVWRRSGGGTESHLIGTKTYPADSNKVKLNLVKVKGPCGHFH